MQSEKLFEQAVQLAAAFVANGDVRLGAHVGKRGQAHEILEDLIPELYETLSRARQAVSLLCQDQVIHKE